MDEATRVLIRQLCTKAGMIMEDASAVAVLAPQEAHLDELCRAAQQISALLSAAGTLRDS